MKLIPLTRGQVARVDDADYEWLTQWKWCSLWSPTSNSYYAVRTDHLPTGNRMVLMHREILGLGYGDGREGDHEDHDTLNNQRYNLRNVSHQGNIWNRKASKGYYWNRRAKKFHAQIRVDGVSRHLGFFSDEASARSAYLTAKAEYHKIDRIPA